VEYLEWISKSIPKRRVLGVPLMERGGISGMEMEWNLEWNLERERSIVEN